MRLVGHLCPMTSIDFPLSTLAHVCINYVAQQLILGLKRRLCALDPFALERKIVVPCLGRLGPSALSSLALHDINLLSYSGYLL